MNQFNKKYNSVKIPTPPQKSEQTNLPEKNNFQNHKQNISISESYYEIEYDACPMPGVGKFVLKSQKIDPPQKDEIRELFYQMRDIAREDRYINYVRSELYDKQARKQNSRIFYKQGMFMKDFEDTYENIAPFSSYFPDYQMMGYDQLRTYFTWRTKVRKGEITFISPSYLFLYLYELLNNIGVDNPEDGLHKIMSTWNDFRVHYESMDKYILKWLKDYHIYYDLPWTFKDFVTEHNLGSHFPQVVNPENNFDLYCSISKYDIRKSGFYNDDTVALIRDCFDFVIYQLQETFSKHQLLLDNLLFQTAKNMIPWIPFGNALFYPGLRHPDKQVIISEKEIYVRQQNKWMFHSSITTESGKKLIGYLFKQMEATLRKATKYKYKLSVNMNSLSPMTTDLLNQAGISLEKLVTEATMEFFREATKTVVKVNPEALEKIRKEALLTQEKLIVPETMPEQETNDENILSTEYNYPEKNTDIIQPFPINDTNDPWESLRNSFTCLEKEAILILWENQRADLPSHTSETVNMIQFAQEHDIMPEVLIDGINEKAADCIGDSLLDGEFIFYEDYIEQIEGMVQFIWQEKFPQE